MNATSDPPPSQVSGAEPGQRRSAIDWRSIPWFWLVYAGLLAWVMGYAALLRFHLPQTPIIDPDSWGYLGPGLDKLNGGEFRHINGRNFLYPAFLYAVVGLAGDLRAIPAAQHLLGLLTGLLLITAWNALCGLLVVPNWTRLAARLAGLLLVASFLFSRSPILFETSVRPEAVFPLPIAASFLLNFLALGLFQRDPKSRLAWACLALNLFIVGVAQALKPSMGFGAAAANLPLLYYSCRRGAPWRTKIVYTGSALLVYALLLALPERLLARDDAQSTTFLPQTLLTIHADIIHEQITDDLRTGDFHPYNRRWLEAFNQRLDTTLAASRRPENNPWESMGFSPDYLMYIDPVFYPSFQRVETEEMAAFCFFYYKRAWLHRPGEMLAKVGRQLGLVYRYRPVKFRLGRKHRWQNFVRGLEQFRPSPPYPLAREYQMAWDCAHRHVWNEPLSRGAIGQKYLASLETLKGSAVEVAEPVWIGYFNQMLSRFHFPLLFVTVLAAAGLLAAMRWPATPLTVGVLLIWLVNFGMFLTIAVVHCLGAERYVENQRICLVFAEFATFLLMWQGATSVWQRWLLPRGARSRRLPAQSSVIPSAASTGKGISISPLRTVGPLKD